MNSKEKSDPDASKVAKFLTTDPAEIDKKVTEPIRDLLSKYSHIPAEETVELGVGLVRDPYIVPSVARFSKCLRFLLPFHPPFP